MGGETKLTGPDLEQGVALDDVPDGGSLVGHALGDAVLLVRQGGRVTAIGATCTHYGGPLGDGLVVGDTVRCPWHHACFSVRTGEPLEAPALNPEPTYRVEVRNGRVRVTERIDRDPLERTPTPSRRRAPVPSAIVIVGAGAAGSAAAEMLRREGYTGRISMVDPDADAPYDRPNLSKDYLAGNAPEEWIPLRPPGFYQQNGIERIVARATSIDVRGRRVQLDSGAELAYDRLLLATGASPIHLDLPGADRPHVHYLRSLADSRRIIANTASARQAVVVGASFIGLEVAASLRARGLDVHVIAPEAIPFTRILGDSLGQHIRALHEAHGVVFHLGASVASIAADAVTLTTGETLQADIVVLGIGVRPVLSLAEQAGLATDRGVTVSATLETSVPDVFAAGDIARWPDARTGERIRVEHWVVAQRQGQCAARNMLGAGEPFTSVPFFWSQHYDVAINYVGHVERWDKVEISGNIEENDCAVAYHVGDRVPAVVTIFRDRESLDAEAAMGRNDWSSVAQIVEAAT